MAVDVYLENNVTYDSYLEPEIPLSGTIIGQGTAVTSINGISGPTVTFAGGTSGFSFAPGGTTITLVSPLTTKGDLYTHNSTVGIALSVGADTFVLTADSAQATGMKWAAPTTGTVTHTGTLTAGQLIIGNGGADITVGNLSGDVTTSGSTATTLASVIAAGGPTGSATVTPIITYDAKGRLTTVTSATVTPAVTSITGLGTGVATALAVNTGTTGSVAVDSIGTWTPTRHNFTEVLGGGSITATGTYVKVGNMVHQTCIIAATGGATIAAIAGTSFITGQPFSAAQPTAGQWINTTTESTFGTVSRRTTDVLVVCDNWTAATQSWALTCTYEV